MARPASFAGFTSGAGRSCTEYPPHFNPDSEIQTCIVHLIRNSLSFCNGKDRKPVELELKKIYNAKTAELAAKRLEDFEQGLLGRRIPAIAQCCFLGQSSAWPP